MLSGGRRELPTSGFSNEYIAAREAMPRSYCWNKLCSRNGCLYHVTSGGNKSSSTLHVSCRSMDSGDDGGELPDDVIETVAKANTINTEYPAHILPEIRAAPCPIHTKRDRPRGQESIYATNSHVSAKSPRRLHHPVATISAQQNPNHCRPDHPQLQRKNTRLDINVKIPEQYPAIKPSLPKNMSSKDYVMTWLIHGSAPQGSNHFPDIIPNNHVKTKKKKTPRRQALNE